MLKQVEDKLLNFWMDILPELENSQTKLEEHLKRYLSIDIDQAFKNYYYFEKPSSSIENDFAGNFIEVIKNQLFSNFFQMFILMHNNKISTIIQQTSLISNKTDLQNSIYEILYRKLFAQGYLVLVNELNFYRLNHRLKGVTEEQQYDYFCSELIITKEFLTTLEDEYPSFLKELSDTVENTINYIEEVIYRTEQYSQKLEECFSFKIKNSLEEIHIVGDPHNNGKSVCILDFKSGKLIYKPKSLKTENNFQSVLKYINKEIPDSKLYEMKIFTNDDHGWCEFIPHEECKTFEESKRCYKRIGKLLAILYSLNGVDFHYENVIFKGEFPVLIDLETLFSVPIKDSLSYNQSAFIKASNLLRSSVLSVGLLPAKMKLNENNAVSIGALDIAHSYEVPTPTLVNLGSSKMKVNINKQQILTGQSSITNEVSKHGTEYITFIKDGFTEIYQWIGNNQNIFKQEVVKLFKNCQVRIVVKPTMVYSQLISTANHPDFLTRDIHKRIIYSRVGLLTENEMLAKSEIHQLEKKDIPYFSAKFGENNLYYYSNNVINNVLKDSPEGRFCKKIESFNKNDLERQLNFIDTTFFKKDVEAELTPLSKNNEKMYEIETTKYQEMAIRIGNHIKNQAIFGESDEKLKEVVWLDTNVANIDIEDWTPEVTSFDLYNGLSGVAIFYMNLAKVTGSDENNLVIIQSIISMLKTYITSISNKSENIQSGMMTGVSGILMTIFEYSQIYQSKIDEKFIEENINILQKIIAENNPIDYVGGNVGALALMIKIIKKTKNKDLENKCRNIADLICIDFNSKKETIFSQKNSDTFTIYSGFSHGLSGLINYLYEYYKITDKYNIYRLFKECLDYQRTNFWCSNELDWFVSNKEEKFAYGWCHGSPGILIEKINLKKMGFRDELIDEEIFNATNKIIENLGANISMCHGDLGNLLILKQYLDIEENENIRQFLQNATSIIYQFIDENIESGKRMTFNNFKGLLLGIAGIGDFMLKCHTDYNKQELIEYLW